MPASWQQITSNQLRYVRLLADKKIETTFDFWLRHNSVRLFGREVIGLMDLTVREAGQLIEYLKEME